MPDEVYGQVLTHLFATYGPAAIPIIGLLLVIRHLLEKDKERENVFKIELEAERERTRSERKRADDLNDRLLIEARGSAILAEEVKNVLHLVAAKGQS